MPTGYTSELDEKNMSTKQWIMESLSRSFGICAAIRDEPLILSEEEILKRLQRYDKSEIEYHKTELVKAQNKLLELKQMSDVDWTVSRTLEIAKIQRQNQKNIKEANTLKKLHEKTYADLFKILSSPKSTEITKNIVKYGVEQLNLVASETVPYITEVPSLEKHKEDRLNHLNREINYHTEELDKAEGRAKDRLVGFLTLKKEVEEILREE